MVNHLGHKGQGVTSDLAALRLLAEQPFDLRFLDWKLRHQLPEGNFGLLQTIKRCCLDLRVIMISGWVTNSELGLTARQLGAAGFLNKPIHLDRLAQEIERVMGNR